MSPHSDEFAQLKKLLATKRHEQPPPGYFERFSDRVIRRIEDENPVEENTGWLRLIGWLTSKPVLACAYGGVVVGALFAGFRLSEDLQPEPALQISETLHWFDSSAEPSMVFSSLQSGTVQPTPFAMVRSFSPASGASSWISAHGSDPYFQPVSFTTWTRP